VRTDVFGVTRHRTFGFGWKQGTVRVEVPATKISGEYRAVIERRRKWFERDLRLVDHEVSYFTLQERSFDSLDEHQAYAAQVAYELEADVSEGQRCEGYADHDSLGSVNLRVDSVTLDGLSKNLGHELRHRWQLDTTLGGFVSAERREREAREYVEEAWPRLLEDERRRPARAAW
jgi:hypothetical protein